MSNDRGYLVAIAFEEGTHATSLYPIHRPAPRCAAHSSTHVPNPFNSVHGQARTPPSFSCVSVVSSGVLALLSIAQLRQCCLGCGHRKSVRYAVMYIVVVAIVVVIVRIVMRVDRSI